METRVHRKYEENGVMVYHLERVKSFDEAAALKTEFVSSEHYDLVINHDADAYDAATGELLLRFRKGAMPKEVLMAGVDNYRHSVAISTNRGDAAGGSKPRGFNKDGTPSKVMEAPNVHSGNVGFMNPGGMVRYCRMTAFGRDNFEKLQNGRPFVEYIDDKYKELCPDHHKRQVKSANETNANYVLWDTAFSTITVNQNFRTRVHQDGGDHPEGMGNLFVYREGNWTKGYFVLPEFGVGVDMQNRDMLFVDVHRFHGNDEFEGFDEEKGDLRISFVLYYRTGLRKCNLGPKEEVQRVKKKHGGYFRL